MVIPSQERVYFCIDNLFNDRAHVDNLSKGSLLELLTTAMFESLILFDQEFSKQHGGIGMGFPLGPTIANIFLCCHEKNSLQNCLYEFKPVIYRRYVDDTFLIFSLETSHPKIL